MACIVLSSTLEERAQKKKVKKGQKKEVRVKLWGVFLGHTYPHILLFFFFSNWGQMEDPRERKKPMTMRLLFFFFSPLGTNGRSKREKEANGQ
jgi:hypothetical protein